MKTDRSEATKRPWRVETVLDEVDQLERKVISIPGPPTHESKHIASICTWGGRPEPEADANAALIVSAVNQYDAVEALIEAAREFVNTPWQQVQLKDARDKLRSALAAFEKGNPE